MISIFELPNETYAVGAEGQEKTFFDNLPEALVYYYMIGGEHIGLTSKAKIRKVSR